MVTVLPELGAASIGAVAAFMVVDRVIRERPTAVRARLYFAGWVIAFAAGAAIETTILAGSGALPWLGAGAATGGLARMAISNPWNGLP
jgi:hypothetical protein